MVNIIPITSRRLNEGYLMVDHRASPGLTKEESIKLGYGNQATGEGQLYETKTNHCNHCGTVVIMNPDRTRERSYCQACNKYICDNCGLEMRLPDYVHKTYKQQIDESLTFFANKEN
jgi:predicted RNA-binding Zn-ribbon protein involved in translation (DUF1610 family)